MTGSASKAFTLVELLVGLLLSLMVAAAAIAAFHATRTTYLTTTDRALLEERGQRALTILSTLLRRSRWGPTCWQRRWGARAGHRTGAPHRGDAGAAAGRGDAAPRLAAGRRAVLSVIEPGVPCLSVSLRQTARGMNVLKFLRVGYSRSEQGGFQAASFTLGCRGEQRQVRLGAQGRIRLCTPGRDADCDATESSGPP